VSSTTRTLARITLATAGAVLAALVQIPAASAAGGAPSLTDAYVDAGRYAPGSSVTVSAVVHETTGTGSWSGNVAFTVSHDGTTVTTGTVPASVGAGATSTVTWTMTPPSTDFTGYLVSITAGSSSAATAIDVSSTWTHYPRFGALTSYPSGTSSATTQADVDQLVRRYHINALQFYDWMWRHENPIQRNPDGSLPSTWTAWNGDVISPSTVESYISAAHADAVAAMPYTMSYAALQDYQSVSGVSPDWALKYAATGQPWAFMMKPNQPATNLYMFNPANTQWQSYITSKYLDEVTTMGFDGVHLDQLGAVEPDGVLLLLALGARDDDGAPVAQGLADHGEADASVAGGPFHNGRTWSKKAPLFSLLDDSQGCSVLHRTTWVHELRLSENFATGEFGKTSQSQERRAANVAFDSHVTWRFLYHRLGCVLTLLTPAGIILRTALSHLCP